MNFEEIAKLHPKKFTEECALISVCFTMGRIKDDWFLNYISAPGGAWQEIRVLKDQIEQRFYIGKNEKRADLVMQKQNKTTLFYIAEAKEFFRLIMVEREKIDKSLNDIFIRLKSLRGTDIKPLYSYIIGIDTTGLKGEFLTDAIRAETDYIKTSINKLPPIDGGRVCVLVYWDDGKTKFSLIFSEDFSKDFEEMFKKIFL
jgi:hypothetical protein